MRNKEGSFEEEFSVEQKVHVQMIRKKTLNKSNLNSAKCISLVESIIALSVCLYEYSVPKLIRTRLQEL